MQRPVKWIEDRLENLQATTHSRAMTIELEIGCEAQGGLTALKAEILVDIGAYVRGHAFLRERVDRARDRLSAKKRLDWLTGKLQSRIDLSQSPEDVSRALHALPKGHHRRSITGRIVRDIAGQNPSL